MVRARAPSASSDLAITGGTLTYRDGATGRETRVAIDGFSLRARDAQSAIDVEFRGAIDDVAVALSGEFGSLATLADARQPYPVAFRGQISGRKASVAAKVRREKDLTTLQDIDVTFGSSSVRGRVDIRSGGTRARWTVDLTSPCSPSPTCRSRARRRRRRSARPSALRRRKAGCSPTNAFPFDALHAVDAERQGERSTGSSCRTARRWRRSLRDSRFATAGSTPRRSRPSAFGGTLTGALKVDAPPGKPPAIALRVDGRGLDVGALLAAAGVKREVRGGKTEVSVDVTMRGQSPHQWASSVSGRARAVVGPATLVNTKLDPSLPFDRLVEVVNPFRARTPTTELTCAVIRLPLANGVATIDRTIALETKEIDVSASGTLDFRSETLDLSFRPRIRRGIPVDIAQFADLVRLRGPFAAPTDRRRRGRIGCRDRADRRCDRHRRALARGRVAVHERRRGRRCLRRRARQGRGEAGESPCGQASARQSADGWRRPEQGAQGSLPPVMRQIHAASTATKEAESGAVSIKREKHLGARLEAFLLFSMLSTLVNAQAGPTDIWDRFHLAVARSDRTAAADMLAPGVQIFESGFVERTRDEYLTHHFEADAKFAKAVTRKVTNRNVQTVGTVSLVLEETETNGSYEGQPVRLVGTETAVLQLEGGNWRIVHIHWSSRKPKP